MSQLAIAAVTTFSPFDHSLVFGLLAIKRVYQRRGVRGIEPRTCRTQNGNHTTRPNSLAWHDKVSGRAENAYEVTSGGCARDKQPM